MPILDYEHSEEITNNYVTPSNGYIIGRPTGSSTGGTVISATINGHTTVIGGSSRDQSAPICVPIVKGCTITGFLTTPTRAYFVPLTTFSWVLLKYIYNSSKMYKFDALLATTTSPLDIFIHIGFSADKARPSEPANTTLATTRPLIFKLQAALALITPNT